MAILSANLPTTNISDLNLSFTGMTDASFQYLSQALPMTSLASLVLSDNKLTHVGMQSLGLSLRDTPRLKHLDLGSNQGIADLGAQRIVSALLEGCSLESLCLEKCNIGFKAVWPLSKTLRKSKIRVLKVSENPRIGPPGLTKLGNGLCGSLVEEFYAAGVTGKDAGCRAVADSLLGNSRVRVLDLRDNQVTNDGANALASVVGASCVQRLFLEENSITDRGIKFLASALLKSQVVELAVECNLVEDEGVLALERAFAEIRKKRTIKIRY
ncbi:hypothetical protein BDR26DRAFT_850400 [Obelidium mucronatum]|nr:hypothetical protein BDR26DRAFT_850400 [Obelidium mucronatum]